MLNLQYNRYNRSCPRESNPNLVSLLALSGVIAKDVKEFQSVIKAEKEEKKRNKDMIGSGELA